jgi:hypothetical protein
LSNQITQPSRLAAASRLRAAAAVVGIAVLPGCSLPANGDVNALDSAEYSDVVFGESTTTTAPPEDDEEARTLRLYYVVGQEGLGDVLRPFAEPNVAEVLDALQQPPSEDEVAEYAALEFEGALHTELPAGLNPRALPRESGSSVLGIEVDDESNLRTMPNEAPTQAEFVFSQLVCTLTSLNLKSGDKITEVEFYDSAGRIPIVDSNRSLIVDERAGRSDFRDCETVKDRREAAADAESTATTEG